jgi:hypothetical protein
MKIMRVTSGTMSACVPVMRTLLALVLLGGCVGGGSGGSGGRPAVMPLLSELPGDPVKRDAVLDSASVTAGPEHRKGMTSKERKAETAAATAAAILGNMFSSTSSVTIGTASEFDEQKLLAPHTLAPLQTPAPASDAGTPEPAPIHDGDDRGSSNADLIPWIKLK